LERPLTFSRVSLHAKAPSPLRSAGAVHKPNPPGREGFRKSGGNKDSAPHEAGRRAVVGNLKKPNLKFTGFECDLNSVFKMLRQQLLNAFAFFQTEVSDNNSSANFCLLEKAHHTLGIEVRN
jgi:hypothetical protein